MSGGGGDTGPKASLPILFQICLLAFTTVMTFGGYFVYDMPGSLTSCFQNVYGIGNSKAELAYSLYNWPNCVLPFLFGYLTDRKLGRRRAALIFATLTVIGQAISVIGTFLQQKKAGEYKTAYFAMYLAGRMVYGFGNESLFVTQMKFIARWFDGKTLATAFALTLAISRGGSSANFNLSPLVAHGGKTPSTPVSMTPLSASNYGTSNWGAYTPKHSYLPEAWMYETTAAERVMSLDTGYMFHSIAEAAPRMFATVINPFAETIQSGIKVPLAASPGTPAMPTPPTAPTIPSPPGVPSTPAGDSCPHLDYAMLVGLGMLGLSYLCTIIACLLDIKAEKYEAEQFGQSKDEMERQKRLEEGDDGGLSVSNIVATVLRMPIGAWIIISICVFFYNTIFTFMTDAQLFIAPVYYSFDPKHPADACQGPISAWGNSKNSAAATKMADHFISIPYTFAMIGATIMGLLIDLVGWNIHWTVGASVLMAFVHGVLFFSAPNDIITSSTVHWGPLHGFPIIILMLIMGMAYTMVGAALWPMLVPLVKKEDTATAYGIMDGLQQFGLGLFAIVAGALSECHVKDGPFKGKSCPACYPQLLPRIRHVILMLFISALASIVLCCTLYLLPQRRILLLPSRKHAAEMERMQEYEAEKKNLLN